MKSTFIDKLSLPCVYNFLFPWPSHTWQYGFLKEKYIFDSVRSMNQNCLTFFLHRGLLLSNATMGIRACKNDASVVSVFNSDRKCPKPYSVCSLFKELVPCVMICVRLITPR